MPEAIQTKSTCLACGCGPEAARRPYEGETAGSGNTVCAVHETDDGNVCLHIDAEVHALALLSVSEARDLAGHLGAAADLAQLRAKEAQANV